MAYRRFNRSRRYVAKARSYGGRARRSFRRGGRARGFGGMNIKFLGGAALGMYAPRLHPMQDTLINLAAIVPIRLPYGIQNIAKGYTVATIAKGLLGWNGGNGGNGGNFA